MSKQQMPVTKYLTSSNTSWLEELCVRHTANNWKPMRREEKEKARPDLAGGPLCLAKEISVDRENWSLHRRVNFHHLRLRVGFHHRCCHDFHRHPRRRCCHSVRSRSATERDSYG